MKAANAREISSIGDIQDIFGADYDVEISHDQADLVARRIEQLGLLKRISDPYAGVYLVPKSQMSVLLRLSNIKNEMAHSVLFNAVDGGHPLLSRAFANPKFWDDFRKQVDQEEFDPIQLENVSDADFVPASDRIVTLSHNQQIDLEASATELIDEFSKENSIDGDVSLKDQFLGQLRAGRELIRALSFRAYLLHETLFSLLGGLIERYKGQAIGQVARKLLDLLIEHVFGK